MKVIIYLLFLSYIFLVKLENLNGQVFEQDSLALVDLYNTTNGNNWINNTNWLTAPVSSWYGITVVDNRVTEIDLLNNNLIGILPSNLYEMDSLRVLILRRNGLTGTVPSELGNLINLQTLNLSDNQLTGTIPSQLGNLSALQSLFLSGNNLNGGIPTNLGNLHFLQNLLLDDNQLTGSIPSELGNLPVLLNISLDNNQLTGPIPPELGQLLVLRYLILNANQLSGSIPSQLGSIISLHSLILNDNNLSGEIPPQLEYLSNLRNLRLEDNQLIGSMPPEIGNLSSLENLNLSNNQLSGNIPSELGNLTNLINLILINNQLAGHIPQSLGNLSNLQILSISINQLTGDAPPTLGNLANLVQLNLQNNQIVGLPDYSNTPIDSTILNLDVHNNKLTFEDIEPNIGIAPTFLYSPQDSIGERIDTTIIYGYSITLSVMVGGNYNQYQWRKNGNDIPGAVSNSYTINFAKVVHSGSYTCQITNGLATDLTLISRPTNLIVEYTATQQDSLVLAQLYNSTNGINWLNNTNWLNGPINTWYGITVSEGRVTGIDLDYNNLVGNIPPELGNLDQLVALSLNHNSFNGLIPQQLGNLSNLQILSLQAGQLSGPIPTELGNLVNLEELSIHQNQLSGIIPPELGNLLTLRIINLRNNQISGSIPAQIGFLTNLQTLNLSNNQLGDSIPSELGNLLNLNRLDLHNNALSGSIPAGLGNLSHLLVLDVSRNQIAGNIPFQMGNIDSLQNLNLSQNMLSGLIPIEIGNLLRLQYFNLYKNKFVDMPDFQNTPMTTSIKEITVQDNRLTFEDLEPNINIAQELFIYSPQDSIGIAIDTTIDVGDNFEMSVFVGGDSNSYHWMKDGIVIPGADSTVIIIVSTDTSDAGTYTCQITNSIVTELTIHRRPIHLKVSGSVEIKDGLSLFPTDFRLDQNYPNPFNPVTAIRFATPKTYRVSVKVFNILGEQMATICDDFLPAGEYEFEWNANNLSSGVYWYRLEAGNFSETRKMILIR